MARPLIKNVVFVLAFVLLAIVEADTPPGIANNPSHARCLIKKYKMCYNLEHVCPKFCPDSCTVECVSCKPICGPGSSPPPPDTGVAPPPEEANPPPSTSPPDQSSSGEEKSPPPSEGDNGKGTPPTSSPPPDSPSPVPVTPSPPPPTTPTPSPSPPTPATPTPTPPTPPPSPPSTPTSSPPYSPPPPTTPPLSPPPTPTTPKPSPPQPTPSTPSPSASPPPSPSSPDQPIPVSPPPETPTPPTPLPPTPSSPPTTPPAYPTPSTPPTPTPSTPSSPPSPPSPTPSPPTSTPPTTPTPSTPSPSTPTSPTPYWPPPSPGDSSEAAAARRRRCRSRSYPQCYGVEHVCPSSCPSTCEVDCVTCKPVCKCDMPGAVCQDPRFIGGDGITFYFHGKKDKDFCLVTEPNFQINAHFIGRRNEDMKRDFTWVQSIGILFGDHQLFVGAQKTATWNDAVDRFALAFDGEPITLSATEGFTWQSPALPTTTIKRDSDTNSVIMEVDGLFKISAKVVPISQQESKIHNYGITEDDCFAHLELGFKFFSLSGNVNGVLGQTYRDNYVSRAKMGVPMPVLGGEREFAVSNIFATDCPVSLFQSGKFSHGNDQVSALELPSMKCGSGIDGRGVVCKR